MYIRNCILLIICSLVCFSCSEDSPDTEGQNVSEYFAKGADVSWITEFESLGYKFYNSKSEQMECMRLLKEECGVNSIRLRVWVNPKEKWNNIDDVAVKARRAADLGLDIMIDFHYSDYWADPSQQETPEAWKKYDITELREALKKHTNDVLIRLKAMGITPKWVQIGNETRNGFLYPLGMADNKLNFVSLVNSGYDAVKSVFPKAKVIIHLDNGHDLGLYKYIFDILKNYGGKYDMIGMSLYPEPISWRIYADKCLENIETVYSLYGRDVMICEIGMNYKESLNCGNLISYLIKNKMSHLKGIFYWEPECPIDFGYDKGCFIDGRPTSALDAFKMN